MTKARWLGVALGLLAVGLGACGHTSSAPTPSTEPSAFLFSYFTRNGEDGVHLAYSRDGVTWLPLNGGKSVITPAITGSGRGWQEWNTTAALMRDPSILRGPDGMFHLVWTVAWTDHAIGVAHSRDLIHWSEQTRVPVMEHEPDARQHAVYDELHSLYRELYFAMGRPDSAPVTLGGVLPALRRIAAAAR